MSASPLDVTATLLSFGRALRARQGTLLASHGLHAGQDALLMQVWQAPGITPSELAARLGVESPTVTRMVHRLERAGLLERRRDADDGRRYHIHPTPRSRLLEVAIRRAWTDLGDEFTRLLGDDDCRQFMRLAARAREALRDVPP
jgi:DNA-binding MarR family transcriptional regulator